MRRVAIACAAVILTAWTGAVIAQETSEKPPESLAWEYFVSPAMGQGMKFEAGMKQHFLLHKKANDPWRRDVWQVVTGDQVGSYIIRTGGHTWADFDHEATIPGDREDLAANVSPYMSSVAAAITEWDAEISRWPPDLPMPKLVEVTVYHLKPGAWRDFYMAVKKVHVAIGEKKLPMHYGWEWTVSGGHGTEITLAIPHATWADFKGPGSTLWKAVEEVYSETEADMLRHLFSKSTESTESFIVAYRDDLSYVPATK